MKNGFTLAEGAAHIDASNNGCRAAFTLAEVLITLGVIGVVAALTIPTLISKHQKKVWVTQLKKNITTLQNSYKKIMADEGVDSIFDTPVAYKNINGRDVEFGYYPEKFAAYFGYNLVSADSLEKSLLKDFGDDILALPDGSCLYLSSGESKYYNPSEESIHLMTYIDVNCDKAPNKPGRDTFLLPLDGDAKINFYGYGSFDNPDSWKEYCNTEVINEIFNIEEDNDLKNQMTTLITAFCTGRIINDGWEMNY